MRLCNDSCEDITGDFNHVPTLCCFQPRQDSRQTSRARALKHIVTMGLTARAVVRCGRPRCCELGSALGHPFLKMSSSGSIPATDEFISPLRQRITEDMTIRKPERIPLTFEHNPGARRSFCILVS